MLKSGRVKIKNPTRFLFRSSRRGPRRGFVHTSRCLPGKLISAGSWAARRTALACVAARCRTRSASSTALFSSGVSDPSWSNTSLSIPGPVPPPDERRGILPTRAGNLCQRWSNREMGFKATLNKWPCRARPLPISAFREGPGPVFRFQTHALPRGAVPDPGRPSQAVPVLLGHRCPSRCSRW